MTEAQERAPGDETRDSHEATPLNETQSQFSNPFASSAMDYLDAGFQPIRARKDKSPADTGVTGWNGQPDDPATLGHRVASGGFYNIGLRLDGDLIGIDVDAYKPAGEKSWREAIDAHGEPPATWISTSRDLPSGIRLYRWAHPIENDERKPAGSLPGIETLHRGHRHMMVTPSVHPEGRRYRWIRPDGTEAEPSEYPQAENVPRLSDGWVEHFRKACECFETPFDWRQFVVEGDGAEKPIRRVLDKFHDQWNSGKSRHDVTTEAVGGLYALQQWPGYDQARAEIESQFLNAVTTSGDKRSRRVAQGELERMWKDCDRKFQPIPFEDRTRAVATVSPTQNRSQLVDLVDFIGNLEDDPPAIWGSGDEVLWASGEPMLVVSPTGIGKTTLAGNILAAQLTGSDFLGFPVTPLDKPHLYIAADRPRQIARRFETILGDAGRGRVKVWRGPLPFGDLGEAPPDTLAEFIDSHGCGSATIDSLGDVAVNLSRDETGGKIKQAFGATMAAGFDLGALHHQRKAQADNKKPKTISDVYGSQWITAGAGSVLLLWGNAGDPYVDFEDLKRPAAEIGKRRLFIDHEAGRIEIDPDSDPLEIVRRHKKGIDASKLAEVMFGKSDKNLKEKARRQLERLHKDGLIHKDPGDAGSQTPSVYRVIDNLTDLIGGAA